MRIGIDSIWKHKDVDFTHLHTDGKSTSVIDHFMMSPELIPLVTDVGPIHRGDNLSRHSPICLTLKLGNISLVKPGPIHPPPRLPDFDRATGAELEKYTTVLREQLEELSIPTSIRSCEDCHCQMVSHRKDSDSYILEILIKLIESSYLCLPLTGRVKTGDRAKKPVAGWNKEVRELQINSNYCYRAWLADGKPNQGTIHKAKLRAHSLYMQAIRRVKRNIKRYEAEALLEAAMKGDVNLMREMKRVRTGKSAAEELPSEVEGAQGEEEIANKFKEVYEVLYNSAQSEEEMEALKLKIQGILEVGAKSEVDKLTGEVVKEAVTRMKPHKLDVSQGWSSDSLLHGPDLLFEQLAYVFRCWMVHGYVTQTILACAFIPLLKSTLKDPASCDSYRAIAGSSLILKSFEQCIMILWGDKLCSDSLQFGFKKRCSTNTATWLVTETIGHFLRGGSKPITVVLDCSKAFDMARFSTLFSALLEKGVPAIVVRVLSFSYKEQQAWVRWGRSTTSRTFKIRNGTRQGSVASPSFWSVYMNPLFDWLRQAGIGCEISGMWIGIVGYADDIILLAPNRLAAEDAENM